MDERARQDFTEFVAGRSAELLRLAYANVVSAPHIDDPIPGGTIQIAGNFTRAQAEELAAQLQSGPLPVDFRISAISNSASWASSQAAAG
ncbi:MAG TPA: hypothetical protein VGS06_03750 [Streptosporangiaceae bacterium]|nr:hypothetical protein [Streptosporangiaceae bacterium]